MRRLLALALLLFVACAGKLCGDPYLAELSSHQGEVERDQASAVGKWGKAERGARFHVGDGLRTGPSGSAELSLDADGVALVESNTLLRFLDRDPREGDRRLAIEEGAVRIESGQVELDVHTPRAFARIRENSSVRIIASGEDLRFDVLVGRVAIEQDGGVSELVAGQKRDLAPPAPAKPVEQPTAAPPGPAADEPSAADEPANTPRASDFALAQLESLTLHAPALPLAARIGVPACAGNATLEIAGRTVEREGNSFVARLAMGTHPFRVRCDKRLVKEGTLRVRRDLATMELPKSAQELDLDADGRRYTVRYQNLLPVVTVRWPGARPAASYTLTLRRGKRERTFRSARPERKLGASELSEGDQEFWFASASGQRSEIGTLRLEFDNTAHTLSLAQPSEGSTAEQGKTTVSGVALLRSDVSANGVPLELDAKGRFSAQVPLTEDRSVVVRSFHPAAGVHYYVRRLR